MLDMWCDKLYREAFGECGSLLPLFHPGVLPLRKRRQAGALPTLRDEGWRLRMSRMAFFAER
jgi:hypothetical protein